MREQIFEWFVLTWVVLGVVSLSFFRVNKNPALKRRVLPVFIFGTAAVFVGFVFAMTGSIRLLLILVPVILVISFLNLRRITFCDSCGKTVYKNFLFRKTENCPACGAPLRW